jgi:hypothetical protein
VFTKPRYCPCLEQDSARSHPTPNPISPSSILILFSYVSESAPCSLVTSAKSHGHFHFLTSFQRNSSCRRLCVTFRNKLFGVRWGVLSHTSDPWAGGSSLAGCPPTAYSVKW